MKMREIALAEDWTVDLMAVPGKTVGPAAEDGDCQSCVFLCVVQWVQQGSVLAFTANGLSISDWMYVIHFSILTGYYLYLFSKRLFKQSIFLSPTHVN